MAVATAFPGNRRDCHRSRKIRGKGKSSRLKPLLHEDPPGLKSANAVPVISYGFPGFAAAFLRAVLAAAPAGLLRTEIVSPFFCTSNKPVASIRSLSLR